MEFDILMLLVAFAGGLWGGFVGALETFIFCGFVAIAGAAVAGANGYGAVTGLAFGPIIGPQVSFAGGAAAAAYLYKKGEFATGRDIATTALGTKKLDALLVAGLFGVLGYLLWWVIQWTNVQVGGTGWVNPIALSIVINAIIVRLVFGKTGVFGKVHPGNNRWRQSQKGNWIPWMTTANELLILGLGLGVAAAWSTLQDPKLAGFWFGLSAAMLILLQFNVKVPVWHHMVLAPEQAVANGGDLWWGVSFGVLGAFLGEFYANLFTSHGDTHIDPPSVALATTYFLMFLCVRAGLFTSLTGVGSFGVLIAVIIVTYGLNVLMKKKANSPDTALAGC